MTNSPQFLDLNQFQIKFPIGSGSFSKVYQVIKRKKCYSAKVCNFMVEEDTKDSNGTLSLFREVNLLSLLDHPSILKFIGYSPVDFEGDRYPTIVTEFAENGTLKDIIEMENSGLSPNEWDFTKKQICIYGVACGMKYMHLHGIIHRDLKPENILMDEFLYPKIADFGLSKFITQIRPSLNMKSQKGLKGTPCYMAPEIFEREAYSKKSDVYSFAFIVYEILTGKTPFENLNIFGILSKVAYEGLRPKIQQDVPDAYRELIEICWSHNIDERPSFDEIVQSLKTNQDFITDMTDQDALLDYFDYIDHCQSSFDISRQIVHFEDFIKDYGRNKTIHKVSLNQNDYESYEEEEEKDDDNKELKQSKKIENKSIQQISEINGSLSKDLSNMGSQKNEKILIKESSNDSQPQKINEIEEIALHNSTIKIKETINNSATSTNNSATSTNNSATLMYPLDLFLTLDEKNKRLVEEAEQDPTKQNIVGKSLIEGMNNFPINVELGVDYLIKSISNKNFELLVYVTKILIKGEHIVRNLDQAKKLILEYDKNTDGSILYLKGIISLKEQKYSEAINFFHQGSKKRNPECMYKYGKMNFLGRGCIKDDNKAFKYFKKSAQKGSIKSKRFIEIFNILNKNSYFRKIPLETQQLIISKISNDQNSEKFILKKDCFNEIKIQPKKTEMIFYNSSLKSTNFHKLFKYFKTILIEIDTASESSKKIYDFLIKLQKKFKNIEIVAFLPAMGIIESKYNLHDFSIISLGPFNTYIKSYSFASYRRMKRILIPHSVNQIEISAFQFCSSLQHIVIPNSVIEIDTLAFDNCISLKEFVFPSSITEIPDGIFLGCSSLEKVIIPSTITKIGDCAFQCCTALKEIALPSSLTEIGKSAFSYCSALTNITIPLSVTKIGDDVFLYCVSLKKIYTRKHLSLDDIGLHNYDCQIILT